MEIELASDEKNHRAHGANAVVAACFAFGCLKQTIDLFAIKYLAQLFTVQPDTGGTLDGDMGDQATQVGALTGIQVTSILEQRPTQPFQGRISLLLDTAHLIHSRQGMGDDVEFIERDACIGQMIGDTIDEGRRHIDTSRINLADIPT